MANRRYIDFPIASTSGDTDIILIWQDGANKQTTKATFLSGLPENLEDLNDVAISGLTNGQILRYDSVTGKWENTDQGNLDLNDLNDVSIVSPSNGQVLVYNSSTSKWENSSGGFVPYVGAVTTVDLGAQGLRAGYVRFDTTVAGVPNEQGLMFWDADDETVDIILNGYTMKIGEDLFYPVKNQTGSTIAKGVAVRFNGTVGASGRLLIAPFIADGSVPSSRFMGVTAEEILNGEDGKVLYFGRVRGINTNAFNEGDILYASTTSAGGYQTAIPVAPNNIVQVAAVVTKSATVGTIFVRPTLGSNINKDEGVKIVSVADKNLLQYQSGTSLWENKSLAQVLGGTSAQFVKGDGSLDSSTYGTGTVTSVGLSSATSGVTIGSTPVTTSGTITLAIATASGSQNGLLSSTDWTTFNSKQNALTNPVTGTGASGQVAYFTGTSAISSGSNFAFNSSESNLTIQRATSTLGNALTISKLSDADQAWLAFRQGGGSTGTWRLGYTGSAYDFTINAGSDSSIGTQALRIIQTSQNVLIGTSTTDNGARLQVSGYGNFYSNSSTAGNANGIRIEQAGSGDSAISFLLTGVREWLVGIDNSDSDTFKINNNTGSSDFNNVGLAITTTGAATFSSSVTSSFGSSGANFNSNAATTGSVNAYRASNSVGVGSYGIESNAGNELMTGGLANATLLQSVSNTALQFGTNQTARLTITSIGNVGINTNTPNVIGFSGPMLTIAGTGQGQGIEIWRNSNSIPDNEDLGLITFLGGTSPTQLARVVGKSVGTNEDAGALSFQTCPSGGGVTDRMRITSIGNVLIGTTTDIGERLTLNGRIGIVSATVASGNSRSFFVRGAQTVADGGTLTLTLVNSSLVFITENNTGTGALFFAAWVSSTIIKISDPSNMFDVADTAGKLCIFKSATTDVATIKNRLGSSRSITVTYIGVSD